MYPGHDGTTLENPLKATMREWLPELDFGVMSHGFARHGRDYVFVLEVGRAGTYELTLTHVVELNYETRVRDDVWPKSWSDVFTSQAAWEKADEPDGYVWGTNWSLAYPGLYVADEDATAARWAERLGQPMYAMAIETDRFKEFSLIFHQVRQRKLLDEAPVVGQALIPPRLTPNSQDCRRVAKSAFRPDAQWALSTLSRLRRRPGPRGGRSGPHHHQNLLDRADNRVGFVDLDLVPGIDDPSLTSRRERGDLLVQSSPEFLPVARACSAVSSGNASPTSRPAESTIKGMSPSGLRAAATCSKLMTPATLISDRIARHRAAEANWLLRAASTAGVSGMGVTAVGPERRTPTLRRGVLPHEQVWPRRVSFAQLVAA